MYVLFLKVKFNWHEIFSVSQKMTFSWALQHVVSTVHRQKRNTEHMINLFNFYLCTNCCGKPKILQQRRYNV